MNRNIVDPRLWPTLERDVIGGLKNCAATLYTEAITTDNGWADTTTPNSLWSGDARISKPTRRTEIAEVYRAAITGILFVYSNLILLKETRRIVITNHSLAGTYYTLPDLIDFYHDDGVHRILFSAEVLA